jgi:two-component system, NtrC family, response regulator AtoC
VVAPAPTASPTVPPGRGSRPASAATTSEAPVIAGGDPQADGTGEHPGTVRAELDALERRRILDALATCAGNQTKAAKMLGMSRRTLLHRLDAYGVARPRKGGI